MDQIVQKENNVERINAFYLMLDDIVSELNDRFKEQGKFFWKIEYSYRIPDKGGYIIKQKTGFLRRKKHAAFKHSLGHLIPDFPADVTPLEIKCQVYTPEAVGSIMKFAIDYSRKYGIGGIEIIRVKD